MTDTKATCCYCGTGCGVLIESDGTRISGVRGDPEHPANFGRLCTKGATLHLTTGLQGRLLHPELRGTRDEPRRRVGWDAALGHAAARFARVIREAGPDAVAFYVSGQLLTEDYYAFNKLARALIGTNNIDSNSRLCMSSAVAAYTRTLGADAVPCSYEDLGQTDCLLIAGSNTAFAHPVLFRRIEDAKAADPDLKLIVVDPRRTDTAACADLHLSLQPGTDLILYSAMLNVLLWEGLTDPAFIRDHTEGFDALRAAVWEITPAMAAERCGVRAEDIVTAARWFGTAPRSLSLWCQGLNQSCHGTDNGVALIHLHLATGQIGRPGAGPFSLTGQPNAMGGREVGAMATLLSGHRRLADPEHREEMARFWGIPRLPDQPGLSAVELFEAVRRGEVKALWIACTNPAQSLPEQALVRAALERAEFIVLQESFGTTETAQYADLLLPAATWGEKEGTVTNSERRISRVRRAVSPPGEARPDWQIARDFALHMGRALDRADAPALFHWVEPREIFREHAASTRGRDLDISGLDYPLLDRQGPQQWPFPAGAAAGTTRLFTDHRFSTPNGRARFLPLTSAITAEPLDAEYPLHLNTGRLRDHWHGMSRTGRVARLFSHEATARLLMYGGDMAQRRIDEGEFVRIKSRRGEVVLPVASSDELGSGQTFLAMHWGRQSLAASGANELLAAVCDPYSEQPELKHAAVQVTPIAMPWQALVLRNEGEAQGQALEWRDRLRPLLGRFPYASLTLAGRETATLVLRMAGEEAAPSAWLDEIDAILGLDEAHCQRYLDPRRAVRKKALVEDGLLVGLHLAGETAAGAWLQTYVVERRPLGEARRWLFAPFATAPSVVPKVSRILCNCHNVSEEAIGAEIASGADLEGLQSKLRCGTSCGSCLPEIKRLLSAGRKAA